MKIELEIPEEIIRQCREMKIADVNIPYIFKDYCQDRLGYYVGVISNDFSKWAKDDDNTCGYVEKTKKAFVEVKMVIEVSVDGRSSIEEAINEMSENIPTCDLISSKGCIVGGKVDEFIVKKID